MASAEQILGDYRGFVRAGLLRALEAGIDTTGWPVDHVCYRVSDWDGYQRKLAELKPLAALYATTVHNGREITKLVLREPLVVGRREVPLVELPGPKEGQPYPEGLEHIELVVPDYEALLARHRDVLSPEGSQSNPTALLRGGGVKFHPRSLRAVVEAEGVVFGPPSRPTHG
jgi:predicted metalloenzyme YecM